MVRLIGNFDIAEEVVQDSLLRPREVPSKASGQPAHG